MNKLSQNGFTLIELMLAMTIFSAVMVIATVGFIGMNRSFVRGMVRKDLSEAAQSITEDIARAVRSQGVSATILTCNQGSAVAGCDNIGWSRVCLSGGSRYLWQNNDTKLYKDFGSCNNSYTPRVQLLNDSYRVQKLEIIKVENAQSLFKIKGVLTTKDLAALAMTTVGDPYSYVCRGSSVVSSAGMCAVEKFSFTVNANGGL